jgi:hypothetical protein
MENWYKIKLNILNQLLQERSMSHKKIERKAAKALDKDAKHYHKEEKHAHGKKKAHLKKEEHEAKKEAKHLHRVSRGRD